MPDGREGGADSPKLVDNLLVVLHHAIRLDPDGHHYMKEAWWDYAGVRLRPLCRNLTISTLVATDVPEEHIFQRQRVDPGIVSIESLPPLGSGRLGKVTRNLRMLRVLWGQIGRADLVWLFFPSWRNVAASLMCSLRRRPYVAYFGARYGGGTRSRGLKRLVGDTAELCAAARARGAFAAGPVLADGLRRVQPDCFETVPALRLTSIDLPSGAARVGGTGVAALYVGNLTPGKRVPDLIRTVSHCHKRGRTDTTLTIVGPGDAGPLRQLAGELGVEDSVVFTGPVPQGQSLWQCFKDSDVFLLASESEGFPRVLYEAMAQGLPIVTTPVGSIPITLRDEQEGLFVPVGDPEAMAEALLRLAGDATLRDRLITNGSALMRSVLAQDPAVQTRTVVEGIVKPRRGGTLVMTNMPALYRMPALRRLALSETVRGKICFARWEARRVPIVAPPASIDFPHCWLPPGRWKHLALARELGRLRPGAVIVGGVPPESLFAFLYHGLTRRPLVVWWGGTAESEAAASPLVAGVRRHLYKHVSQFISYGWDSAAFLEGNGVARDKIVVVGNVGMDVREYGRSVEAGKAEGAAIRSRLGLGVDDVLFLSVGRLARVKGHANLIQAFSAVREHCPQAALLILGEGPEHDHLGELMDEEERIWLGGQIPWEEMPGYYAAADVYVHPSLSDQWPQTINQAMSAALPIIATRQSGVGGLIRDGREGYLLEGDDLAGLQERMELLAEDSGLRSSMGRAARGRIGHLTLERFEVAVTSAIERRRRRV